MHFNLGELFCGPGGMAIASTLVEPVVSRNNEEFSLSHSWGVDHASYAIDTFKANLGEENGIHMDAWDFVNTGLTPERKINALAFGFPCNSFSQAGERLGVHDKKFGKLYQTGIKVLDKYNPVWFVAENVSGISGRDSGRQFKKILNDLSDAGMGYNVVAHLYKFEEYGVPQARHRYVIVGIRHDIAKRQGLSFLPPAPTHGNGRIPFVSVEQALYSVSNTTKWGGQFQRQSENVVWRLRFTPPGENAWKLDELVDPEKYSGRKLVAYLRELPWYDTEIAPLGSAEKIRAKIEECRLHCKKARMSMIYRRLEPDKPAYTITGSGGGGTHVYHWMEHRALTNEERAALQTFPKTFVFKGSSEQVRKQIGMAVPTLAAKQIFAAILKTFAGIKYESVQPDSELVVTPDRTKQLNLFTCIEGDDVH